MKSKIIYLVLLAVTTGNLYSQANKTKKAEQEYDKYAYIDAIKTYEHLYSKGYKSPEMLLKIGNAYYFNGDLEKAAKWYGELYTGNEDQEPEFYYRYSQSLRATKDYVKADTMMDKFNTKSGNDSRAKIFDKKRDYLAEIKKNSGRYKIDNAGINSKYSDYGTAFYGNKVVFSSARDTGNFSKRIHTWTGQYFTNLYSADMSKDSSLGGVDKYGKKLNTKFHESTTVFSKDGKTVYFTRNNYLDKRGYDGNKVTLLKIYRATLVDSLWTNITVLPFNSDSYQVANPALSNDGKTLYFASDMEGSIGQSDIFKVAVNGDGSFGTPVNLGPEINTSGRETFPFVSGKDELYFTSDGHPGLGGLDIFITKIPREGPFKEVLNVGEPANTPKDDFALIINTDSKQGFLSSNREGGEGSDDIYKFIETREIEFLCEQLLVGIVTDTETKAILPNTKLTLFDEKFTQLRETTSDAEGKYDFGAVDCGEKYYVRAALPSYTTKEVPVTIIKESGKTKLPIELESAVKKAVVGDDLGKLLELNIIYFDLDKWNIRADAALELEKVLSVLEQYPTMKIEIRSHTDSRATAAYNEKLSDRRAKSTMAWLIKKGINSDRLTAKGYGESKLVNQCADGVLCTEDEHQANRRSEFILMKI
jgi:outer membrane protein OmpA-like peptidoglycan-associated protein/tetratricopeptide (TPR) repeat protein